MYKRAIRNFSIAALIIFMAASTVLISCSSAFAATSQSYKVEITTSRLNIRQYASLTSRIVGWYYKGNIVDVYGQVGNFLKTSRGYIYSSYTRRYITQPAVSSSSSAPAAPTVQSYRVTITSSMLHIRQYPSLSSRIVGNYYRNNIIDVYGQSGSFLKTSLGYIYSSYTQKYIQPQPSRGIDPPQPYKIIVTAKILNIRQSASLNSRVLGLYYSGNIVDAFGQIGNFVKTSKGYVWAAYTQKYNTPQPVVDNTGKYIKMNSTVPVLLQIGGTADERYAVQGKVFKIIGQKDSYYMIKMGKVQGYIPQSSGTVLSTVPDQKLTLAWDYIYSAASNRLHYNDSTNLINSSSSVTGLDVISPTWFDLTGDYQNKASINVEDKGDRQYVTTAHKNGYEVWPLISEFDLNRAYEVFYDSTTKSRIINQIVQEALKYDVDGINIDFEALGSKNRDGFTAFVRDLSQSLKQYGLTVSVDVTVPTTNTTSIWTAGYDRPALSSYVDYMMLMAYDEHYAGSDTAGSVASEPWVENGIKTTLSQGVSSDKLLLGVPFYLRDFKMTEINLPYDSIVFNTNGSGIYSQPSQVSSYMLKNSGIGDAYKYISQISGYYIVQYNGGQAYVPMVSADYVSANTVKDYVLSSEAISLAAANSRISANGGSIYYDSNSQQDVGTYNQYGYKHLVWLENAKSMSWRMDLVNEYKLPGMAAWSMNWDMPGDVWNTIKQKLNK